MTNAMSPITRLTTRSWLPIASTPMWSGKSASYPAVALLSATRSNFQKLIATEPC